MRGMQQKDRLSAASSFYLYREVWIRRLKSPLLLKEGKARSAGVVLKEPRSAPIKERYAGISCSFASLENHPDSLREPPLLQKEGSCCPNSDAPVHERLTSI